MSNNENFAQLKDFNGTKAEVERLNDISKITQKVLKDERHINITMAEAIPTIVYEFLHVTAEWLEKNKSTNEDVIVNLMNLMDIGVPYRESEDGE